MPWRLCWPASPLAAAPSAPDEELEERTTTTADWRVSGGRLRSRGRRRRSGPDVVRALTVAFCPPLRMRVRVRLRVRRGRLRLSAVRTAVAPPASAGSVLGGAAALNSRVLSASNPRWGVSEFRIAFRVSIAFQQQRNTDHARPAGGDIKIDRKVSDCAAVCSARASTGSRPRGRCKKHTFARSSWAISAVSLVSTTDRDRRLRRDRPSSFRPDAMTAIRTGGNE